MNTATSKFIFTNSEANLYSWQLFISETLDQIHSLSCYQPYQRIQSLQSI